MLTGKAKTASEISLLTGHGMAVSKGLALALVQKKKARPSGSGFVLASAPGRPRAPDTVRDGDYREEGLTLLLGDAEDRLSGLEPASIDCIVTSSPYYRERDYGPVEQIGWEPTPAEFVGRLVRVLAGCSRALADHGLIFFNLDDYCHVGTLACLDAQLMVRLGEAGLEKHREIIWVKNTTPNGTDRSLHHTYEKLLVLRKPRAKYYWDALAAQQPGVNGRARRMTDVWEIGANTSNGQEHGATFPTELVSRVLEIATSRKGYCSKCGTPWERQLSRPESEQPEHTTNGSGLTWKADWGNKKTVMASAEVTDLGWARMCRHQAPARQGRVLDPFSGTGTTGVVAAKLGMDYTGIDVNAECLEMSAINVRRAILERRAQEGRS